MRVKMNYVPGTKAISLWRGERLVAGFGIHYFASPVHHHLNIFADFGDRTYAKIWRRKRN